MVLAERKLPGLIGVSAQEFAVVFNPGTPDRTAAIGGRGPSPLPWLRDSADLLRRMGAAHLAYPCNTAHYFLHRATEAEFPRDLPLVDMIVETAAAAAGTGLRRIGLLATTGTIQTDLYQEALVARGLEVMTPHLTDHDFRGGLMDEHGRMRAKTYATLGVRDGEPMDPEAFDLLRKIFVSLAGEQEGLVMETIVGVFGVKAGYTTGVAPLLAAEAARRLVDRGAEALVLGCTELPLVLTGQTFEAGPRAVPLIDSTRVMADRLRALSGRHGIAGGLGPEATVDLLEKMQAPADMTTLQRDVLRATVEGLGARRDQDHLKMLALAGPDPIGAARQLADVGADFLVLAESAVPARQAIEAATGLPVVAVAPGERPGPEVVRRAAPDTP